MKTIHRLKEFIDKKGISLRAFETEIALSNGYIGKQIKSGGSVGSDVIEKIFDTYPALNPVWLLTGKGKMLTDTPLEKSGLAAKTGQNAQIAGGENRGNVPKNVPFESLLPENAPKYNFGVPQVITLDSGGKENIAHVPVKARAGYLLGYGDPEYIAELQAYRLPGLRGKSYRSFEVEGMSMAPGISGRDWVIGEWVESIEHIRENRVHIIVTADKGILIKRVLNRVSERGVLYLKSDTIHNRHDYPNIEIEPQEIREIWYARIKFSADFSEPSDVFRRLAEVEIDIMEMKKIIGLEKL